MVSSFGNIKSLIVYHGSLTILTIFEFSLILKAVQSDAVSIHFYSINYNFKTIVAMVLRESVGWSNYVPCHFEHSVGEL